MFIYIFIYFLWNICNDLKDTERTSSKLKISKGHSPMKIYEEFCLLFSGHPLMMLCAVPSFIKIFLVVLKLQRRCDF